MIRARLLFATLALPVVVCGCGRSGSPSPSPDLAGDGDQLCAAINLTGLVQKCLISERDNMVDVVVDTGDDEKARRACAGLAKKVTKVAEELSAQGMKMRIYSPFRSDKALATCSLNAADGSVPY